MTIGLLLILVSPLLAQGAGALQPTVSPDTITVGDLLTYSVEVPLTPDETITGPGAEAPLGKWEVRAYNVQPAVGKTTVIYALTAFEIGDLLIPSIDIAVTGPAGKPRTVRTAPVKARVASVLQGEETRPADIVGPLTLREKPADIAVRVLLLAIVLALVVLAVVFLWRRRRRRIVEEQQRPDPPDVVALKALRALRAEALPESGRIKQHYSELSDILRAYLAARWGLRTLEETTWRIVAQMRQDKRCAEHAPVTEDLLREADLVKFAKARPEPAACWSAVDGAERFVRDSAAAPLSPLPPA